MPFDDDGIAAMTDDELDDLPQAIRQTMPIEAQQLYLAALRRTREKMKMGGESSEEERSEAAHRAALFAVEQQFHKDENGRWREAPVGAEIDPDDLDFNQTDNG
jgi:cation transport regulator ChaB